MFVRNAPSTLSLPAPWVLLSLALHAVTTLGIGSFHTEPHAAQQAVDLWAGETWLDTAVQLAPPISQEAARPPSEAQVPAPTRPVDNQDPVRASRASASEPRAGAPRARPQQVTEPPASTPPQGAHLKTTKATGPAAPPDPPAADWLSLEDQLPLELAPRHPPFSPTNKKEKPKDALVERLLAAERMKAKRRGSSAPPVSPAWTRPPQRASTPASSASPSQVRPLSVALSRALPEAANPQDGQWDRLASGSTGRLRFHLELAEGRLRRITLRDAGALPLVQARQLQQRLQRLLTRGRFSSGRQALLGRTAHALEIRWSLRKRSEVAKTIRMSHSPEANAQGEFVSAIVTAQGTEVSFRFKTPTE